MGLFDSLFGKKKEQTKQLEKDIVEYIIGGVKVSHTNEFFRFSMVFSGNEQSGDTKHTESVIDYITNIISRVLAKNNIY